MIHRPRHTIELSVLAVLAAGLLVACGDNDPGLQGVSDPGSAG